METVVQWCDWLCWSLLFCISFVNLNKRTQLAAMNRVDRETLVKRETYWEREGWILAQLRMINCRKSTINQLLMRNWTINVRLSKLMNLIIRTHPMIIYKHLSSNLFIMSLIVDSLSLVNIVNWCVSSSSLFLWGLFSRELLNTHQH